MAIETQPFHAGVGQILFRPGDACTGFLQVLTGQIKVYLTSVHGREIVLYRVKPGDICLQTFACLTTGVTYAAEGIVEEGLSARLLPASHFQAALNDVNFRTEIHQSVARRFGEMECLVETMVFNSLDQRLAAALMNLSDADGHVSMTHEALAAECGSAREAISRRLSVFAREGIILLKRGQIAILDIEALRHRATQTL